MVTMIVLGPHDQALWSATAFRRRPTHSSDHPRFSERCNAPSLQARVKAVTEKLGKAGSLELNDGGIRKRDAS